MKKLNARAHWEVARSPSAQCANYCRKEDTYTGGLRLELGEMPKQAEAPKRSELLQQAAEELDCIKEGYKRPSDIPSLTLMQCGFMPAYKALTSDVLGPFRPSLKILTLIGRPGTGKSYSIQMEFPVHGKAIYGNSGCWFQNPTSDVMVFEEFCGQIPLQRMLTLLDPYPDALEVKGSMAPAMYTKVIITSNTMPSEWYKNEVDASGVALNTKRQKALEALWDRLGFCNGDYVPVRDTGTCVIDGGGMSIAETRQYFHHRIKVWAGRAESEVLSDDEDPDWQGHELVRQEATGDLSQFL